MRLSKIKLAGFKSFVDPTTISFPGSLIGVVGPNGCGKSNVIDAVRWVMGETSAKLLRGDSMADVIFNGSSSRKPVGSASIELIFDNSDGKVGGQFANFAEISVRRVVSRDGTSAYYLNNTRCRRKDITQLFLGTGLGPRSYAIIEQGMISRIIEARPEEMRVYLEEAAGISKYKDRRRETENRIRHTRENLSRLTDLRDEVDKQIRHLQRQARTAERYKDLKDKERRVGAELLALRLGDMQDQARSQVAILNERETELQAAIAELRGVEAELEKTRAVHVEQTDDLNEVQGRYYKAGAEIARIEQSIQHAREMRQRQERDLEQVDHSLREVQAHIERDESQIQDIDRVLAELGPGLDRAQAAEHSSQAALRAAEEAMQAWQSDWEAFNREAGGIQQTGEVERARIEQIETQIHQLVRRRERSVEERDRLSQALDESGLAQVEQDEREQAQRVEAAQADLQRVGRELGDLREEDRQVARELDEARGSLQQAQGKLASLEALQQAALGQSEGHVTEWLTGQGLESRPRLAQQVAVEAGWDRAVETVLGAYLEAVCVDGIDAVTGALDSLTNGAVGLMETAGRHDGNGTAPHWLLSKVQGPAGLASVLTGVRVADGLPEALAVRRDLEPTESVVTREGIWLGRDWLRINRQQDDRAGVIQRESRIRELRQSLGTLQDATDGLEERRTAVHGRLEELEQGRDDLQRQVHAAGRQHAELKARLDSARSRLEQTRTQLERLESEAAETESLIGENETKLRDARGRLEAAVTAMAGLETRRVEQEERRATLREQLEAAREQAHVDRSAAQEIAIKVESRRSSKDSTSVALERLRAQLDRYTERRSELAAQLDGASTPLEDQQAELSRLLEMRSQVDKELADARRSVEAAEAKLRELQEGRMERERSVEARREGMEELKLAAREIEVRQQTLAEQLVETGFELEQLRAELPEDAGIDAWSEEVERLTARVQRLGPINLASIDELKEQSERKEYLDAQSADLTDALETLENAIRKIDRETRTRFKETFDQVNAGLQEIFPRLFGGGHAYLDLGSEDLLEAGVHVMARPPGKRISTIHLLSGGEKALTAVALVFAIFGLNPAPFCMLDEVDAPLDDANVGRFCDIVREMSDRVQFIFITHNKITMEMAHQLTGVTMHEPGVSRLVAVDIDEAVQMAAM